MRLYSVGIVSLTVDAPSKWTDNLLSQHAIPEVSRRERGVSRGVPWSALVRIGIIRALHEELGCGVREAVVLAASLLDGSSSAVAVTSFLALQLDRAALETILQNRLKEVMESAPRPRRGRPPRRGSGHA